MNTYSIVIPFHHPWKWHTEYANQTAILLSRRHKVICFLWGDAVSIKEILWNKRPFRLLTRQTRNLYLFQPLHIIPFRRLTIVRLLNLALNSVAVHFIQRRVTRVRRPTKHILWMFGFFEPLFVLLPLFFPTSLLYYDCIDVAWQPAAWVSKLVKLAEKRLVKCAHWMSVNSQTLFSGWQAERPSVFLVPSGASTVDKNRSQPIRIRRKHTKPVIGYIGAIDYRIDFPLLAGLIKRNPQWQFLLAGPLFIERHGNMRQAIETIRRLPNVSMTSVDKSRVPTLLASCDIGIIPYDTTLPFNRYSFPLKLMEYFAAGIPVVSTDIVELRRFPGLVACGQTVTAWENSITRLLKTPLSSSQVASAKRIARANSWERKLNRIMSVIEKDPA